jgi:hypothetical protein
MVFAKKSLLVLVMGAKPASVMEFPFHASLPLRSEHKKKKKRNRVEEFDEREKIPVALLDCVSYLPRRACRLLLLVCRLPFNVNKSSQI